MSRSIPAQDGQNSLGCDFGRSALKTDVVSPVMDQQGRYYDRVIQKVNQKSVSQSHWKDKCDSDANKHIEHGMKRSLTRKSVSCTLLAAHCSLVRACLGNIFGD
jgi:hypothetical protein